MKVIRANFYGKDLLVDKIYKDEVALKNLEAARIAERFDRASAKLNSESETERLCGIYSLNELARQAYLSHNSYTEMVFELLCSHIRMHTNTERYRKQFLCKETSSVGIRTSTEIQTVINILFKENKYYIGYVADLSGSNLYRADFRDAQLMRADFYDSHLEGAMFAGAKLDGALFVGAHLEGADLSHVSLKVANIDGVNFGGANLEGANLSLTRLVNADLTKAILSKATLCGADLSGAKLDTASMDEADIRGIKYLEPEENKSIHDSGVATYVNKAQLREKIKGDLDCLCDTKTLPEELKVRAQSYTTLELDDDMKEELLGIIDRIW